MRNLFFMTTIFFYVGCDLLEEEDPKPQLYAVIAANSVSVSPDIDLIDHYFKCAEGHPYTIGTAPDVKAWSSGCDFATVDIEPGIYEFTINYDFYKYNSLTFTNEIADTTVYRSLEIVDNSRTDLGGRIGTFGDYLWDYSAIELQD